MIRDDRDRSSKPPNIAMPRQRQRDITFYLVKLEITDFDTILPPQEDVTHWDLTGTGPWHPGRRSRAWHQKARLRSAQPVKTGARS